MAPSRHDRKIVDWDIKPQHKQTKTDVLNLLTYFTCTYTCIHVRNLFLAVAREKTPHIARILNSEGCNY